MNTLKPEAVLLAEYLEQFRSFPNDLAAAAELRRLYAENIELRRRAMTVGELIELLGKVPADAKVSILDYESVVCDITSAVEEPGRVYLTWEVEE